MRARRIDVHFDRMDEVAKLIAQIPVYKCLAVELGMNENYMKNVMAKLVRIRRTGIHVPRGTLLKSLCSENEFVALMDSLMRKRRRPHVSVITQIVSGENEKGML